MQAPHATSEVRHHHQHSHWCYYCNYHYDRCCCCCCCYYYYYYYCSYYYYYYYRCYYYTYYYYFYLYSVISIVSASPTISVYIACGKLVCKGKKFSGFLSDIIVFYDLHFQRSSTGRNVARTCTRSYVFWATRMWSDISESERASLFWLAFGSRIFLVLREQVYRFTLLDKHEILILRYA